ncbi:hypothetical protein [Sphingomonas colocasiae]|uniref:Acyl carrier protein n=1 Tax=Sphingomonas colocasiae TaxID=1848973 RepID=A0ABS7PL19_9SPHN|nr:hypothetical protein [Sphingomonas colocasiae]MBY8821928.1 hypothetical protein [Sphingomonas colocasiae]
MGFAEILSGHMPSDIFKEYVLKNPGINRLDLGLDFDKFFLGLDGLSQIVVRKWKDGVLDDNEFDEVMIYILKKVGYIK